MWFGWFSWWDLNAQRMPICAQPNFRNSLTVPFEAVAVFVWLPLAVSFFQGLLSTPTFSVPVSSRRTMVWRLWPCTTYSISSSSTLLISWDASHIWWLLCPPVRALVYFPSLQPVDNSAHRGVFGSGNGMSSHAVLCFPFCFCLFSSHWICENTCMCMYRVHTVFEGLWKLGEKSSAIFKALEVCEKWTIQQRSLEVSDFWLLLKRQ